VSVYLSWEGQIAGYGWYKEGGVILQEVAAPPRPRLLDSVRQTLHLKQYSYRTEQSYVGWIKHFILFHQKRHPQELSQAKVEASFNYLATHRNLVASM